MLYMRYLLCCLIWFPVREDRSILERGIVDKAQSKTALVPRFVTTGRAIFVNIGVGVSLRSLSRLLKTRSLSYNSYSSSLRSLGIYNSTPKAKIRAFEVSLVLLVQHLDKCCYTPYPYGRTVFAKSDLNAGPRSRTIAISHHLLSSNSL